MNIPKILSIAKLPNLKGSPAVRENLANEMCNTFSQKVKGKMAEQGSVSVKDVRNIFKELTPQVNIKVRKLPKDSKYCGNLAYTYIGDTAVGYELKIPVLENDKSFLTKFPTFEHEAKHYFKAITQPKYVVGQMPSKMSHRKQDLLDNFYDSELYTREPKGDIKQPITEKIKDFFKQYRFTKKERAKTLNIWRRTIEDESSSFKKEAGAIADSRYNFDELRQNLAKNGEIPTTKLKGFKYDSNNYQTSEEKVNKFEEFVNQVKNKKYSSLYDKKFRFTEKLDLLKELFKEQASEVRAQHKAKFGKAQ